jgi:hypothetical protein
MGRPSREAQNRPARPCEPCHTELGAELHLGGGWEPGNHVAVPQLRASYTPGINPSSPTDAVTNVPSDLSRSRPVLPLIQRSGRRKPFIPGRDRCRDESATASGMSTRKGSFRNCEEDGRNSSSAGAPSNLREVETRGPHPCLDPGYRAPDGG